MFEFVSPRSSFSHQVAVTCRHTTDIRRVLGNVVNEKSADHTMVVSAIKRKTGVEWLYASENDISPE
jgi:hypothetical protein